jgi:hypothetical protein
MKIKPDLFRLTMALAAVFAFYLYTESENRAALQTRDWDRCWSVFTGSACHSEMARQAAERLSGY